MVIKRQKEECLPYSIGVLYHELAHMEISEHNNDFKALNSQIKRECEAVGRGRALNESAVYLITREFR